MRVKLGLAIIEGKTVRITPAHAGKTFFEKYELDQDEDHPRACG